MNRHILVVTHGGVATELAALAREFLGNDQPLESISVSAGDSLDTLSAKMQKWAARIPKGAAGWVMTDLKNSSATVSALALSKKYPIKCLCGVNLPMLLKALSPSDVTVDDVISAGRSGIAIVALKADK